MSTFLKFALVATALAAAACAALPHHDGRPAEALAIVGGRVLDPSGDAPAVAATVVIVDGVTTAVGPDARIPAGALTIDATGKYLVPGLWDMHAHLAATNPIGHKPEGYVGHGVLGVRDMGGHTGELLGLKRELVQGRLGPELVMAGPTLNGEAFADFHRAVTSEDEGRNAVRELKEAGFDLVKVHRATKPNVMLAILDEARRAGLPVAGHVPLGMSWIEAANAGMQSIEHMVTIVENEMADPVRPAANILAAAARMEGPEGTQTMAALARNHTYLDPTLIAYESKLASSSPSAAAVARGFYMRARKMVDRASIAGVAILAGTDLVEEPGAGLLAELDLLVASGLTPRQALRAATSTAAFAAGRPALGRIQVGAPASFLILDADPSVDILNIRKLANVVLRGRVIDAQELEALRGMDQSTISPAAPL